jgi:acyl transferase domain-containing protein
MARSLQLRESVSTLSGTVVLTASKFQYDFQRLSQLIVQTSAILDSPGPYLDSIDDEMSEKLSMARSTFIIPLSASKPAALASQAERLAAFVAKNSHINVLDLARTLGTRRSKLSERGYALVGQKTLGENLQPEFLQTVILSKTYSVHPFAFVFTGQGAQWPQMGKELLTEFPSFKQSIQELDSVLQKLPERPGWTLEQAILEPPATSQINHVSRSQPVCTAVQVGLVDLLATWGVTPKAVIGHSSGEIGAAYAAGRLTSTQAIIVAYYRGYVVGKSQSKVPGAMMAASLSKQQADAEIDQLGLTGSIKVACINSNESVTISGDESSIDRLAQTLTPRGIFARKLKTNGRAYHSHHMKPLGEEYEDLLERNIGLSVAPPPDAGELAATWISSVYAEPVSAKIMASYWRKNLESPVLFSDAAEQLLKGDKVHIIELGPHSAMEMPLKQVAKKLKIKEGHMHYNSAIIRNKNGVHSLLNLMGQLFLHGHNVSFTNVNYVQTPDAPAVQGKILTNLPPYSWTYDGPVLWNEGRQSRELRNRKYGHHDLLGLQMVGGSGIVTTWRNMLKVKDVPWLEGHKLGEDIVFPAAGFIAMAIEAICQVKDIERQQRPRISLRNFKVIKALPLSVDEDNAGAEIFTTLRPLRISGTMQSDTWHDFEVSTYEDSKYTIHATGIGCLTLRADKFPPKLSLERVDLHELASRSWYDKFATVGLNFGSHFQTMKKIETDSKRQIMKARATVDYNDGTKEGPTKGSEYIMHPVLIDSMLQTALVASSAGHIANLACMVPTGIEDANFIAPYGVDQAESLVVDAVSEQTGLASINIAAELHGSNGDLCGQMENVTAVSFQGVEENQSAIDERHPMMKVIWKPDINKLTPETAPGFSEHTAKNRCSIERQKSSLQPWQACRNGVCLRAQEAPSQHLGAWGPIRPFRTIRARSASRWHGFPSLRILRTWLL